MVNNNSVVAILLRLPFDLFYDVVSSWLSQPLYITFEVLDAAVKHDEELYKDLLCHYNVLSPEEFTWLPTIGYICHEFDATDMQIDTKLCPKVSFKFETLRCDAEVITAFLERCQYVISFCGTYDDHVLSLSTNVLRSMQHLTFDNVYDASMEELTRIKENCRNLESLTIRDDNFDDDRVSIITEIVALNPHLTDVNINATSEVLDVILEKCPNMESCTVQTPYQDKPTLLQVIRLISKLKQLKDIFLQDVLVVRKINNSGYSYVKFERHLEISEDFLSFLECFKSTQEWSFTCTTDGVLTALSAQCANVLLSLFCTDCDQLTKLSLINVFQRCTVLEQVFFCSLNLSNADLVDLFQHTPTTLIIVHLITKHLTLSGVLEILTANKQFEDCTFKNVLEDAANDSTVVAMLKKCVDERSAALESLYISYIGYDREIFDYFKGSTNYND